MMLISTLKKFFSILLPYNKEEIVLFILFLTLYGVLGSVIALDYRIIFDDRIPWDAYFSFDNRAIVMTGGGFERHPLANYFFDFIRNIALYFSNGKKDEIFRLVLAWCSNFAISLNLVQIYKYLRNIICIPVISSWILVIFFGFFSTNILLSFTPETYTYTLFLLSFFNYYSAQKIQKEENIPFLPLTFSAISIGGLTITNIIKIYIPLLFEKQLFKNWKKFGFTTLKTILSVGVFILLFLNRVNFDINRIISKTSEQYDKFSHPKITPIWDMILSWFFGGNILFSNFIIRDYHNKKGFEYKALFMDTYNSYFPYIFVGILLILILWSYLKNFKNTLVQILMLSFGVDIIIHCGLKFGLHTSYIYGGHFIFIYPLLLGWLLHTYRKQSKIFSAILSIIIILTSFLILNNIYRMIEFFSFLNEFYQ